LLEDIAEDEPTRSEDALSWGSAHGRAPGAAVAVWPRRRGQVPGEPRLVTLVTGPVVLCAFAPVSGCPARPRSLELPGAGTAQPLSPSRR